MKLDKRMKEWYENRTRFQLPRRTYVLIRIDGKAFSSFTKGLPRPFSKKLIDAMNYTAKKLCDEIQGAKFAFVQSDEISIVLTDFDKIETSAWFDNNIQKMASVSASIATRAFNSFWTYYTKYEKNAGLNVEDVYSSLAMFDSRIWSINQKAEVLNYFLWRQEDCVKNSISSVAQAHFSHKELHKKNQKDMLEMLHKIQVDWNEDFEEGEKRGRLIKKEEFERNGAMRTRWSAYDAPNILENKEELENLLPDL